MFPKTKHTYFILLYFVVHLLSVFVHNKSIYLSYEILFILALIFGVKYLIQSKRLKELVLQSLMIHLVLTVFYLPTLLLLQGIKLDNPLALLMLYPFAHWLISLIVYITCFRIIKR